MQGGFGYHANMPRNKTLRELLAANVAEVMRVRNLSQSKVAAIAKAKQTPTNQTTVGHVLKAEFPANVDTIEAIANGLGVEPWQLLKPDFKPEPAKLTEGEIKEVAQARQILAGLSAAQRDMFLQDSIVQDILSRSPYPPDKMGPGWAPPAEKGKKR